MKFLRQDTFHQQITFSYSRYSKDEMNVLKIDGFDHRLDPTRRYSVMLAHRYSKPQQSHTRWNVPTRPMRKSAPGRMVLITLPDSCPSTVSSSRTSTSVRDEIGSGGQVRNVQPPHEHKCCDHFDLPIGAGRRLGHLMTYRNNNCDRNMTLKLLGRKQFNIT
ncbi:unnamed protein product [Timema podura]|uniref:Uncharacterized protein n=1 Tax=Timema podura TaxID=61482 RepID=A0ABN7P7E5_TIMPD|nr:unnamed protein product [Timema podura]